MKYCKVCKSGENRQFSNFCSWCSDKLIDVPTKDCECGNKPLDFHVFCVECGKILEFKKLTKEAI